MSISLAGVLLDRHRICAGVGKGFTMLETFMDLVREKVGGYLVLHVDAEKVDATNSGKLKDLLVEVVEAGEKKLVIDFSRVEFMDSTGLAGLLPVKKMLPGDGHVLVVGLTPRVKQLFKLTKVDDIIDIFSSVEEALVFKSAAHGSTS
ncbi:STAS domain-containing protein [Maridesulfovibrio sp. FT414]|uniref:STAS domain-containing protein n=1 Tax=Maridesulfovibrio sp. FT414 TaxID=2979469 RepID=UPI003D809922